MWSILALASRGSEMRFGRRFPILRCIEQIKSACCVEAYFVLKTPHVEDLHGPLHSRTLDKLIFYFDSSFELWNKQNFLTLLFEPSHTLLTVGFCQADWGIASASGNLFYNKAMANKSPDGRMFPTTQPHFPPDYPQVCLDSMHNI